MKFIWWVILLLFGVVVLSSMFYEYKNTISIYSYDNGTNLILKENEFYSTVHNMTYELKIMDSTCQELLKMLRDSSFNIPQRIKDRCQIE